jgi:hypothetical protein
MCLSTTFRFPFPAGLTVLLASLGCFWSLLVFYPALWGNNHLSFLFFFLSRRNPTSGTKKAPNGKPQKEMNGDIYTQFAEESKTRNECELSGIHGIYGITQHDD